MKNKNSKIPKENSLKRVASRPYKESRVPTGRLYRISVAICSIAATVALVYLIVWAGNLDPTSAPGDTMNTLDDIYCAMNIDCTPGSFGINSPGPASSTMRTLTEVYNKAVKFPIPDTGQATCYAVDGFVITCGDSPAGQDAEYDSTNSFTCDMSYTPNGDGTVTDNCTGLMWVQQPQLIIPGAVGVHSTNQIQAARGNWANSTSYSLADLVKAVQASPGVNASRSEYVVTAASGAPFSVNDVGREIFIGGVSQGIVKLFTSSTEVTVSATGTTGAAALTIQSYFVCSEAHTSGTFLDDLAANKWRETKWTGSAANLTTSSTMRWDTQAIPNCEALEYAGHSDWRLPNVKELFSIVLHEYPAITGVKAQGAPYINQTVFPATVSSYYWSSTTYPLVTGTALYVGFSSGLVGSYGKASSFYVCCVRGQ